MSNLIERLRLCERNGKRHVGELAGEAADEIEALKLKLEAYKRYRVENRRLEGVIDAIKHYCYSGGTQVITIQRIIEQDL